MFDNYDDQVPPVAGGVFNGYWFQHREILAAMSAEEFAAQLAQPAPHEMWVELEYQSHVLAFNGEQLAAISAAMPELDASDREYNAVRLSTHLLMGNIADDKVAGVEAYVSEHFLKSAI